MDIYIYIYYHHFTRVFLTVVLVLWIKQNIATSQVKTKKLLFCLAIVFWASRDLHQVSRARWQLYHLHESVQRDAIGGF